MAPRKTLVMGMLLATVLGRSVPAGAQLVPVGPQFQLNSYTTNYQGDPAVGTDGAGNFVVVWRGSGGAAGSAGYDTSGSSIQGQRYDAVGTPLGDEFQVNTYLTGYQLQPALATREDGSFVVVWTSPGSAGSDGSNASVQGQRYDAAGAPLGGEFQVNTYTTNYQGAPSVATDANGGFVVAWVSVGSGGSDTSFASIQGRRYDAAGAPVGTQFQVNTYTTSFQSGPSVAANEDGSFVVAWGSNGSGGSDTSFGSIQAQRYDAAGAPIGDQFQVNTYTTDAQGGPRVTVDRDGTFVVVWVSNGSGDSDTSDTSIQGQRFDASGAPVGNQFEINTYTTAVQNDPEVAMTSDGGFVVTWESSGSPGTDDDALSIQARRYDAAGSPVGGQFQVNTQTENGQYNPAITADAAGNVLVAWGSFESSPESDESSMSVQARRLAVGRPVLGKRLLVKNPTGSESERIVVAFGQESATDIGPSILGDPTVTGATLRVLASGTTDTAGTYVLDASGWRTMGSVGYRYAGPTDADGDPVKKVLIKRTPGGKALLKAVLNGSVGTQGLNVVPPNLGDHGGIVLSIPGGGTYCASFGGAAGGVEAEDDAQLWKVTNATAEGCPTEP